MRGPFSRRLAPTSVMIRDISNKSAIVSADDPLRRALRRDLQARPDFRGRPDCLVEGQARRRRILSRPSGSDFVLRISCRLPAGERLEKGAESAPLRILLESARNQVAGGGFQPCRSCRETAGYRGAGVQNLSPAAAPSNPWKTIGRDRFQSVELDPHTFVDSWAVRQTSALDSACRDIVRMPGRPTSGWTAA